MSDPGLSHRLRQRSRRSGFMIGVSMLLTIAMCAIGFTVLYTALDAFTADFISSTDETPTVEAQVAQPDTSNANENPAEEPPADPAQPTTPPEPAQQEQPQPTATVAPTAGADDGEFNPDFQIASDVTINLREGPSTATNILEGLPPATPLEYLDEDAPTDNPSDGERWMQFETEDGLVGWVREIDVTEYEP
jgi:cytoskeletal protein RodZ